MFTNIMFKKLFETLLGLIGKITWYGTQTTPQHRIGCDGTVTTFRSMHLGYNIRISHYVYVKADTRNHTFVSLSKTKAIPEEPISYFEVNIEDLSGRNGRKHPVHKVCLFSNDESWELLTSLFQQIKVSSKIFVASSVYRASIEVSIQRMIEEFSTQP